MNGIVVGKGYNIGGQNTSRKVIPAVGSDADNRGESPEQ